MLTELFHRLRGRHRPDLEALSVYADGRLDVRPAAALEAHLASCGVCRGRLEELRAVRSALGALPAAEAPRSFRLRQADVEAAPAPAAAPVPWMRALPALSAVALVVFAVLVSVDLSGGRSGLNESGGLGAMRAAPAAEVQDADGAAESQAHDEAGTTAPNAAAGNYDDDAETSPEPSGDSTGEGRPGPPDMATPTAPLLRDDFQATGQVLKAIEAATATAQAAAARVPAGTEPEHAETVQPTTDADGSDDGRDGLRVAEVAAALVALGAGAAAVSYRMRRREATS